MPSAEPRFALDDLMQREWILPNGWGGYAYGTASGINTRKYHGLLVGKFRPDGNRYLYVSGLEEQLLVHDHKFFLSAHKYEADAIYPMGYIHLQDYVAGSGQVVWEYGGFGEHDLRVRKTIRVKSGLNATWIHYDFIGRARKFRFGISPFVTFRNIHEVQHNAPYMSERGDGFQTPVPFTFTPAVWHVDGAPFAALEVNCADNHRYFMVSNSAEYLTTALWYHDFVYDKELRRGYPHLEDLYNPGTFWKQDGQKHLDLILIEADTVEMAEEELRKLLAVDFSAQQAVPETQLPAATAAWQNRLEAQADDFLVNDLSGAQNIIAGYPWFGLWSRDAMVSLEGLLLVRGRVEEAKALLSGYRDRVKDGMLPNIWEETEARYEFVGDAPLLLIQNFYRYFLYARDEEFIRSCWPAITSIIRRFCGVGGHNPHLDARGFVVLEGDGTRAATWMDAIVGGRAVTPRYGSPVEIQALWYNALHIARTLAGQLSLDLAPLHEAALASGLGDLSQLIGTLHANFAKHFWSEEDGYLADVVGHEQTDRLIRPNQLFAAALSFPIISPEQAARLLVVVDAHLLTVAGLRTLAPGSTGYIGHYQGGQAQRDHAYHQGTVWPWLWGPYCRAKAYAASDDASFRDEMLRIFDKFFIYLDQSHLTYIPELFGADNQQPHGTVHQAWNVGQLLESLQLISDKKI